MTPWRVAGSLALGINEGLPGREVLILEIPEEVLEPFEWIGEGKTYREFLVPADIVKPVSGGGPW